MIAPISLSPPFLGKPILNWKIWTSALTSASMLHSTSASGERLLGELHIANKEARVAIPLHRICGLLPCLWLQILSHQQGNKVWISGTGSPGYKTTHSTLTRYTGIEHKDSVRGGDSEIALEPSHCLPNLPRVSEEAPEVANVPLQTLTFCSLRVWMKFTRNDLSWLIVSLPWLKSSVVHSLLLQHEDRKS